MRYGFFLTSVAAVLGVACGGVSAADVQEASEEPVPGSPIVIGRPFEDAPVTPAYTGYRAGAAVENINPDLAGAPIYLGGYGGRVTPASGLDADRPLTVRALSLADASDRTAVMVSLDVVGLDMDTIARLTHASASATWLPESAFTFTSTHTHTAPVSRPFPVWDPVMQSPDRTWMDEVLLPRTVRAVVSAVTSMQPATVSWGTSELVQRGKDLPCGNRHGWPFYDRTVDAFEARAADGTGIATAFFYGCHPVSMGNSTVVSADWPSDARRRIEQKRGGVAIFYQGFGGDVDPGGMAPRGKDGKLAAGIGNWIADEVMHALDAAPTVLSGTVEVRRTESALPFEPRGKAPGNIGAAAARWEALMTKEKVEGTLATSLPMEATSVKLGGLRIVMLQNEVIGEWAPRVRALFPGEHVMLAGYTDGVDSYVPNDAMVHDHSDHNYEGHVAFYLYAHPGPFKKGADETLLAAVARLARRPEHEAPRTDTIPLEMR